MKKLLILSLMALSLVACNKSGTAPADPAKEGTTTTDGTGAGKAEEDMGNAGDESMPNTMALAAEAGSHNTYTGKIDGKIEATLDLYRTERIVRGTITYKKSGKPITVLGTMEEGGTFFLREYMPDGLVTGVLSGEMKGDKLSGTWSGTGNYKEQKLEMTNTLSEPGAEWPYPMSGSVAGEYGYHYPEVAGDAGAAGGITVKNAGGKLTYSIDCVNGPPGYHVATIEETEGTLEGDEITYNMADGDCQIVIRFFKGFAVVEHMSGHYDCGFGMGAGVEGEYMKLR